MADERNKPNTHFGSLESKVRVLTAAPTEPVQGDVYYDSATNRLYIYAASAWRYAAYTTTTSTSTSSTTTSTSTTSTSSSTSSSTSTSSSSSTSTTTTL